MTSDNPYQATNLGDQKQDDELENQLSPERAAYNVVSDTVAGVNLRKSDNLFQAIFVAVAVLLSSALAAVLALFNRDWGLPWYGGAMVGAFFGLVVGVFTSGIFLMVYRGVRHMRGKHD